MLEEGTAIACRGQEHHFTGAHDPEDKRTLCIRMQHRRSVLQFYRSIQPDQKPRIGAKSEYLSTPFASLLINVL